MAKFGSESQRPITAQEAEASSQPGPGEYKLPSSLSATGAPIFGKEEKCPDSYEESGLPHVPGPKLNYIVLTKLNYIVLTKLSYIVLTTELLTYLVLTKLNYRKVSCEMSLDPESMTPLLRGGALLRPKGYLDHHAPTPSREPTAIPLSPMPDPVCVGEGVCVCTRYVSVRVSVSVWVEGGGGRYVCMYIHIYRAGRIHVEEGPGTRLRR